MTSDMKGLLPDQPIEAALHIFYLDHLGREQKVLLQFSQPIQEMDTYLERMLQAIGSGLKKLEGQPISVQLEILSGQALYQRPSGQVLPFEARDRSED